MTLLTAAIAAVIVTLVWYFKDGTNEMRIGTLSLMYWGATLMWLVDAVVEYIELKAAYFTPEPVDMLNDFFLGISVVVLGLIIWLIMFLIKDPKGVLQKRLQRIEQRETATDGVIITSAAVFLGSMKYPDQSVRPNVRKHIFHFSSAA